MTKDELLNWINLYKLEMADDTQVKTAVDAYTSALLKQCNVSGALEFGKPQMNIAALQAKMKKFFDTVSADELIERFEKLGYEFKPIDGQANDH